MINIIKKIILITILGAVATAHAQDYVTSNFDNGNVSPFNVCTTQSPNYSKVVSKRLKTYWQESSYNGTRMTKGAEVCADWHTRKEGWYGMTMTLGPDYPMDKKGGVAQIFQFVNSSFWSWAAMLQMDDGDLTVIHRADGGTSNNVENLVYANFPKNTEMDIVMHFILSNKSQGLLKIWVNGSLKYSKTNINFGYGSWNSNDEQTGQYTYVDLKAGQYNFENDDYRNNETRTVYYDNLTWYAGSNGYDVVNPNANTEVPPVTTGDYVSMRKSNSMSFAIDGNNGGANAQDVYLWSFNASNKNQHWEEISRGGDYYSYKKRGTNFCLDGNKGGANGQNVYLWTCSTNNQNQHWKKIYVSGQYRLEKRNAPEYSIDGNRGGANRQSIYLWESNNANPNQLWQFSSH